MTQVEWQHACEHFPRLLEQAEQGEEVVICRNAHPVVQLVFLSATPKNSLTQACLSANKDDALNAEIDEWQGFEDGFPEMKSPYLTPLEETPGEQVQLFHLLC